MCLLLPPQTLFHHLYPDDVNSIFYITKTTVFEIVADMILSKMQVTFFLYYTDVFSFVHINIYVPFIYPKKHISSLFSKILVIEVSIKCIVAWEVAICFKKNTSEWNIIKIFCVQIEYMFKISVL